MCFLSCIVCRNLKGINVQLTNFFQLWVAYAPCGAQHKDAVQVTLEQIDLIKRMVEAYPNQLELVRTADGKKSYHLIGSFDNGL